MSDKNSTCVHDISTISTETKPNAIAVEAKDNSAEDYLSCVLRDVTPDVKKRILELRNLQLRYFSSKIDYYKELQQLERKYADIYKPLLKTRFEIINGIGQPSLDIKGGEEGEKLDIEWKKNKVDERRENLGIPDFWLTVFRNSTVLSTMINEEDELVLKHLKEVTVKYVSDNRMDFVLEFHFEPNEYFDNPVLTKEYRIKCHVDPEQPFDFVGPEIVECEGSRIDWKEGKDITRPAFKRNNKTEKSSEIVRKSSFFGFFDSLKQKKNSQEISEALENDFEIAQYIKEKIIPRAIFYYTKEMEESDYSDEDSTLSESFYF
ncbi:nucleosome assembly protein 1-like 1 [Centruroides vittatus]|uniref:nucleosome assembly protein 1-like 1 n=1 Tax=Centruroides vittatus TaxID=120091 RepID=UPI00350FE9CC